MLQRRRTLIAAVIALVLVTTDRASVADAPVAETWGRTPDGTAVRLYALRNSSGMTVRVMDYGATLVAIEVPDRNGTSSNVILGFQELKGYLERNPLFGSTVGRYANRIANGRFTLDGQQFTLAANNGPNHLHGGTKGFDKFVWSGDPIESKDGPAVRFSRRSPDGEEGYPGNLDVAVTYTLAADNALRIEYLATTDKPTPVNLTNHAYFNLGGVDGPIVEPILDHVAVIHAERFVAADETRIPTGELAPVEGTALDFRKPTPIGRRIAQVPGMKSGGYDHCFVVSGGGRGKLADVATVTDPKSGRAMHVTSTEPGVQFYTASLGGRYKGKGGASFGKNAAFCLETQHFPDSPNRPGFPNVILRPGETYRSSTTYRFSIAP